MFMEDFASECRFVAKTITKVTQNRDISFFKLC